MRSPIEAIEEWLFKISRRNPFQIFKDEVDEAKRFKETIATMKCLACQGNMELVKFERGPKGWECEIACKNCNFKGLVNSAWTKLENINSIGRAREK